MKILGVIPTYRRVSAPKVAANISEFCDHVAIIAKDCPELKPLPSNCTVINVTNEISYCAQRQMGVEMTLLEGYDAMFQVDDDIGLTGAALLKLKILLDQFPKIGAFCTASRVYEKWNENVQTSYSFLMASHATQAALYTRDAVKTVHEFYGSCYTVGLEYMDDLIFGMRLWEQGIPSVRLHGDYSWCHSLWTPQTAKDRGDVGGIPVSQKEKFLPIVVEYIQNTFCSTVMHSISYSRSTKGAYRFSPRYNWTEMCTRSIARNGFLGYWDNKGRKF